MIWWRCFVHCVPARISPVAVSRWASTPTQGVRTSFHPAPRNPRGCTAKTCPHLEQKDFEASREKMLIMSAEISRLEEQFGELPVEASDDVLEIG
jgi:hypothetical protein